MHPPGMSRARRLAKSSPCEQRHAAILVHAGTILGVSSNYNFLHAEVNVVKKYAGLQRNLTIYSLRFRKNGNLALAAPCDNCMIYLTDAGIKKIFYSTDEGEIKRL